MSQRDQRAGAVFDALSDPTRRAVLSLIGERGPLTATELAARLPVTRQAVAKHVATLHAAGLVAGHRQGREQQWSAVPGRLADAAAWIDDAGARWDRRLSALERRVAARRATDRD